MSANINQALSNLNARILACYDVVESMGGTIPVEKTSWNLSAAIASIPQSGSTKVEWRYLKMDITKFGDEMIYDNWYCRIAEITMFDPTTEETFIWPGMATCSSSNLTAQPGEDVQNAFDGLTNNQFNGMRSGWQDDHCSIQIDLGEDGIDLSKYCGWRWYTGFEADYHPSYSPISFSLQASKDGTNWTVLDSANDIPVHTMSYDVAYRTTFSPPN